MFAKMTGRKLEHHINYAVRPKRRWSETPTLGARGT